MKLPTPAFVLSLAICSASLFGCMDRVTEHRVRGNAHFREGDYSGAVVEYDKGLAIRPNDAATLILKGNALYELGQLDEARNAFGKALEGDKNAVDAVRGLALVATRKGDLDGAAAAFERLLTLSGHEHDSATRVNLAKIYLAQGKLDLAEKQAVEAGHENGTDEQVLFTLGRVYLTAGKLDEAAATFKHLAEVSPTRASGPYGLAMVAAKRGDKTEALARLGDAVAKGIPDGASLAKDAAFASLKDDPAFLALVERAAVAKK